MVAPLQDFARGPRKLRRRDSGSVNAIESGWHRLAGHTQSGHSSLLGELAECMPMIFKRHADVANLFMHELDGAPGRDGAQPQSTGEVTGRSRCWNGFVCHPNAQTSPTPLPLSLHTCRCGRQIDKFGHHLASCARAGVFGEGGSRWKARQPESAEAELQPTSWSVIYFAEPRSADGRRELWNFRNSSISVRLC